NALSRWMYMRVPGQQHQRVFTMGCWDHTGDYLLLPGHMSVSELCGTMLWGCVPAIFLVPDGVSVYREHGKLCRNRMHS
ncbi:MAG: hypothetical protein QXU75_03510, partial [Candidatus Methanomethylicaceae archaeon]